MIKNRSRRRKAAQTNNLEKKKAKNTKDCPTDSTASQVQRKKGAATEFRMCCIGSPPT